MLLALIHGLNLTLSLGGSITPCSESFKNIYLFGKTMHICWKTKLFQGVVVQASLQVHLTLYRFQGGSTIHCVYKIKMYFTD